jgi:hypothetical protein|tara:strand:+ start:7263 stop:7478 length:216 start_codon:yes stop_codon:yes gene_type:complete
MKFIFKERGIDIKLSWKERLTICFKGLLSFNRLESYKLNASFMKILADSTKKYGDSNEHGPIDPDKENQSG